MMFLIKMTLLGVGILECAIRSACSIMLPTSSAETIEHGLSDAEKREIKEIFDLFNVDKHGFVDRRHLLLAFKALGVEIRGEDLEAYTKSKQSKFSLDQFMDIVSQYMLNRDPDDELRQAFKLFDRDGSGYITFEKLKAVSAELNEALTDEELKEMISEADKDRDGKVSFEDFARVLRKIRV